MPIRPSRLLPAGLLAVAVAVALPATGGATSPATIANGILSTTPSCMNGPRDALLDCARREVLTAEAPVMLQLNPIGTHIVVLGAGLFPDGTIRPVLDGRLRGALTLAQQFPYTPIVVSGGVPRAGVTEAQAMADWLVAHGVHPGRIIQEGASRSTVENARNTTAILAGRGASGAVVVTSPDHLQRAVVDFRAAAGGRYPIAGVIAP